MKKLFCFCFGCYLLCIANAFAKARMTQKHGALFVEEATYAEAQDLFAEHAFEEFGEPFLPVPRIYFKTLPTDWGNIEKSDDKKRLFIRILLPLILKINEDIEPEKNSVERLWQKVSKNEKLSDKEKKFVEEKAQKYDVFSRNKDENRYKILLKELREKTGILAPALLISMAGVYSDWGNSRLAVEGNSLYREENWYSDEGIEPQGIENPKFRYRKFSSLEESLKSFMHKINTDKDYYFVRVARAKALEIGRPLFGQQVITAMAYDGKLKNIAGMLDFNLSYYKLNKTDMFPALVDVEE